MLVVLTISFAMLSAADKFPLLLNIREERVGPSQVIVGEPAAKRYFGILQNTAKSSILVLVIQMRTRPIGNGRFHACYLERWNPKSHGWTYTPQAVMTINSPEVTTVLLNAGSSVQACDAVLSEETEVGCYRFVLQVQAKGSAAHRLSQPFKVGQSNRNAPVSCPN